MGSNRGILMHISSLASDYGIGDFGKEAFRFVDFLKQAGQSFWQLLPQNPTGFGDSPYQSASAFAGNPYFIDINALLEEGLLKREETDNYFFGKDPHKVDYGKLFFYRYPLLRCAFFRFKPNEEYEKFAAENAYWLDEFSLFMALKEKNHYQSWITWEEPLKNRDKEIIEKCRKDLKATIDFYKFLQFKFFEQWYRLKNYANEQGIKIIGDMPIYVALDSAEVWSERELFMIDGRNNPTGIACCPPDKTYKAGQLWGNPIYNWEMMKRQDYAWWAKRMEQAEEMYDMVRIDHFGGFFEYYSADFNAHDAKCAEVHKGPGKELFEKLQKVSNIKIIAENLGNTSKEAEETIKTYGFYGMKVLQLSVDYKGECRDGGKNNVVYTGTHDNDTILGWYEALSQNKKRSVRKIFNMKRLSDPKEVLIKAVLESGSEIAVIPMQDYLGYGSGGRMNLPSTVGGNWLFRVTKEEITKELAGKIKAM